MTEVWSWGRSRERKFLVWDYIMHAKGETDNELLDRLMIKQRKDSKCWEERRKKEREKLRNELASDDGGHNGGRCVS